MNNGRQSNLLDDLAGKLEGDLLRDAVSRVMYSTAACLYELKPRAIVQPRHLDDVVTTVRECEKAGVPITGRGGGSGLVGQAIGTGVVIDFSRFLFGISALDPSGRSVRVEPGAVLNCLQTELKAHGLFFPPDPSSGNYCTLGGMISTNASGAHSIKYGATVDYIDELDVILAGGERITFREHDVNSDDYRQLEESGTLEGRLHRGVREIAERYADEIARCTPRTSKNSCGYRLDRVLSDGRIHLGRLFAASEGTLGLVAGAKLKVAPIPSAQQMVVLWFADLSSAAEAVEKIIPTGPAAIEIMDAAGTGLIRKHHPHLEHFLPAAAAYEVFVKYDGDDAEQIKQTCDAMCREIVDDLKLAAGMIAPKTVAEQQQLWAVRKALLPILYALPGPEQILGFIEDVAVPPEHIVEFVEGLRDILEHHGTQFVLYGHAGQGNFHVRPVLNPRDPKDLSKVRSIAEAVFDLAERLGGTITGEHGDGLARTPFIRKMYGDLYPAFVEVKRLFDPHNLFNPGRIVNGGDDTLTSNLRTGPDYQPVEGATDLHFDDGEQLGQIEACQGCGACRTILMETMMCPVYKVLRDERAAPRAKANVLRSIIAGRLDADDAAAAYRQMLDYCIGCGSCRLECPSHVDIPKLMIEAKAAWARRHGRGLEERLLGQAERLSRLNQRFRAVATPMMRVGLSRKLMEIATGIDTRRDLPPVKAPAEPRQLLIEEKIEPHASVVYFADIYAKYNDPSIAVAAIEVLEHSGVEVLRPELMSSSVPAMMYGATSLARKDIQYNIDVLLEHVEAGRTILCTEPTATLSLRERYPDYVPGDAAQQVAQNTRGIFDYLRELMHADKLRQPETDVAAKAAYHTPCHLRSLDIGRPAVDVLAMVPGLTVEPINEGCCGMAGTFGMRRKYYDLSLRIARPLLERVAGGGFDFALTDCSTCAMQIRQGAALPVHHPIRVLWAAYGLGTL